MGHGEHTHGDSYYIKIWALLLFLLVVSICGPFIGNKWITLITAFGIAIVKACIVASEFMHLNVEKKFVSFILLGMLLLVLVFFAGSAVEVMSFKGANWEKTPLADPVGTSEGHGEH